jgi:predicted XRE-type DNA-binding protein
MTPELAAKIKALLKQGYQQHQVAALLKLNQGRVSEVNTGKIFKQTSAAKQLPLSFE